MERRPALVTAAATTIVGAGATIALAAFGGVGILGFGTAYGSPDVTTATPASVDAPIVTTTTQPTQVVTQVQDQYDRIVVHVPEPASEPAGAEEDAPSLAPSPPTSAATQSTPSDNTSPSEPEEGDDDRGDDDDAHEQTSSNDPTPPPGCVDGQLEDNGVWNCQH